MKATLDKFLKESIKKDVQIKHQNKWIDDLMKKLGEAIIWNLQQTLN